MSGTVGWTSQSVACAVNTHGEGPSSHSALIPAAFAMSLPAISLLLHPGIKFGRRVAFGEKYRDFSSVRRIRGIHDGADIGRQPFDDGAWRGGWRNHGVEGDHVEAGIGLSDGRYLRRIGQSLDARPCDQLQVTGIDISLGGMPNIENQRHTARNDIGERRRTAVVVDMRHLNTGLLLQHFAGEMPDAAGSGDV